jgi:hypothetical protein
MPAGTKQTITGDSAGSSAWYFLLRLDCKLFGRINACFKEITEFLPKAIPEL